MALDKVAAIASVASSDASPRVQSFGKLMGNAARPSAGSISGEMAPRQVQHGAPSAKPHPTDRAVAGTHQVCGAKHAGRLEASAPSSPPRAAELVDRVTAAQKRLDHVLEQAQSGKAFTPAELLALQAQVYRASQELDLAGKVVEKATGGVKQILQTQV